MLILPFKIRALTGAGSFKRGMIAYAVQSPLNEKSIAVCNVNGGYLSMNWAHWWDEGVHWERVNDE